METISAFIFDMDGVIWREKQPIGNLPEIFGRIQKRGLRYVFATNNSTSTVNRYVELLESNGITALPEQVFTSATTTANYLKSLHPDGGNLYVIGEEGLEKTLQHYGFFLSAENPLAVVVGLDQTLTYEKLRIATLLIRSGVPFVGTNPDLTYPSPEGLIPGAGSLLAAIQAATDTHPLIIGKPKATMFQQALAYLGENPGKVLVVGDRLETDIAGGQAAGCQVALVLSGVSTREMGLAWQPKVDIIAADLSHLIEIL